MSLARRCAAVAWRLRRGRAGGLRMRGQRPESARAVTCGSPPCRGTGGSDRPSLLFDFGGGANCPWSVEAPPSERVAIFRRFAVPAPTARSRVSGYPTHAQLPQYAKPWFRRSSSAWMPCVLWHCSQVNSMSAVVLLPFFWGVRKKPLRCPWQLSQLKRTSSPSSDQTPLSSFFAVQHSLHAHSMSLPTATSPLKPQLQLTTETLYMLRGMGFPGRRTFWNLWQDGHW